MIVKIMPSFIFKLYSYSSYTLYATLDKAFDLLESALIIKPSVLSNFF